MFGAFVAAGACQVYTEDLTERGASGGTGGGGQSCSAGSCWWSSKTAEGCTIDHVPTEGDRPSADPAGDVGDIVVAVDRVYLGNSSPVEVPEGGAPWTTFGFDLDGLCNAPPDCPGAATTRGCAPKSGVPGDGYGCRDNLYSKLIPLANIDPGVGKSIAISEDGMNCELHRGSYSVLIRVRGYDGSPNDGHVRVDFYSSAGLTSSHGWTCDDPRWRDQAPWLAVETWQIRDDSLAGAPTGGDLGDAKNADPDAYVREGYLVARVPSGDVLRFENAAVVTKGLPLYLNQGLVVMKLERDADQIWRGSDGIMAGRVREADMLSALDEVGLCEAKVGKPLHDLIGNYLAANLDVLASGANEPDTTCDSMSMGMAFTARQAALGASVTAPLPTCTP